MSYVTYYRLFWLDVKFARFSCGLGKLTVSRTIAHRVVNFCIIYIYLISIESYLYKLSHGCEICRVRSLTNAQENLRYVFILPICHTISVNCQHTFLSANFCM